MNRLPYNKNWGNRSSLALDIFGDACDTLSDTIYMHRVAAVVDRDMERKVEKLANLAVSLLHQSTLG